MTSEIELLRNDLLRTEDYYSGDWIIGCAGLPLITPANHEQGEGATLHEMLQGIVNYVDGGLSIIPEDIILGDLLYGSGPDTLARLPGNTTAGKQFLTQTGTGTVSAAPAWAALASGDVTTALGYTPVNRAGDTLTGFLTLHADPTSAMHPATRQYVDAVAAGIQLKDPCVVATTANITLSGTQTIDGVGVTAGQRVLVKNQTAPAENGIYVVAAGAWSRATDMDAGTEVVGALTFVSGGTTHGNEQWRVSTTGSITLGTTAIAWALFYASEDIAVTPPLAKVGNLLSIQANGISNGLFRQSGALAVVGRSANSTGDVADIAAAAGSGAVLRESGNAIGWGTIATAGIGNAQVTYAKIQNVAGLSVFGQAANAAGAGADITAGTDAHVLRRSGTTLGFGIIGDASISGLAWSKLSGVPGGFTGFANPTATIGLAAVNGSATTAMRSDGAPALSQAIAPTWSAIHQWNLGATPSEAIRLEMAQPGSAGTRDSHWVQLRGTSFDSVGHNADWRFFVDVTSNAGASTFRLQSRIDAASFADAFSLSNAGAGTFAGALSASNLSGTNTGDQTITLTGDVTGSGTGSFAATIAAQAVTLAKMANIATASILGRNTAGTGSPEVLTALPAAVQDNITRLGTVTVGTWSAGTIAVARGGTGLTALGTSNQLLGVNNGTSALEYKSIVQGSANRVTVTHGAGTITLSAPQDIHSGASPSFVNLNLTGSVFVNNLNGMASSVGGFSRAVISRQGTRVQVGDAAGGWTGITLNVPTGANHLHQVNSATVMTVAAAGVDVTNLTASGTIRVNSVNQGGTGVGFVSATATPSLVAGYGIYLAAAGVDQKWWRITASSVQMSIGTVTDDNSTAYNAITIVRAGAGASISQVTLGVHTVASSTFSVSGLATFGAVNATSLTASGIIKSNASGGGSTSGLQVDAANPAMGLRASGAAADNRWWDILSDGPSFYIRAVNDANSSAATAMQILRSGTSISSIRMAGNVAVGTAAPTAAFEVQRDGGLEVRYQKANSDTAPIYLVGRRSRGTMSSPANVQTGDDLLTLWSQPYSGGYHDAGFIVCSIEGPVTSGQRPGTQWRIATNEPNGAVASRVTISGMGNIGIGTTTPNAAPLSFGTFSTGRALTMYSSTSRAVLISDGSVSGDLWLVDRGASANQRAMVISSDGGQTDFMPHNDAGAVVSHAISIRHSDGCSRLARVTNSFNYVDGVYNVEASNTVYFQANDNSTVNVRLAPEGHAYPYNYFRLPIKVGSGPGYDYPGLISDIAISKQTDYPRMTMTCASSSAGHGPQVIFNKWKGTFGSPANVASGDIMAEIYFTGRSGANTMTGVYITARVDSGSYTPGTYFPASFEIHTSTADTVTASRFKVNGSGQIGLNNNSPASSVDMLGSVADAILVTGSTSISLGSSHRTVICTTDGSIVTLPLASTCVRRKYRILSRLAVFVSIQASGSDNIYHGTSFGTTIAIPNGAVPLITGLEVQSDGSSWNVIGVVRDLF